ncbi:MAG TPA: thioredoxin [Pyrinomonadaceae bacterium]
MNHSARAQIIGCPKCGAQNRVVPGASGEPVCGRCKTKLSNQSHPILFTDRNFADEVERSPLPVLVDFWAAWCGPCRMVAPAIEKLATELSGRVRVGKLDVDKNQTTAARFRVQSIPTLLIFKNGREVERIVGAQSREAILSRLKPYYS